MRFIYKLYEEELHGMFASLGVDIIVHALPSSPRFIPHSELGLSLKFI